MHLSKIIGVALTVSIALDKLLSFIRQPRPCVLYLIRELHVKVGYRLIVADRPLNDCRCFIAIETLSLR
jgi:hypothetical protein